MIIQNIKHIFITYWLLCIHCLCFILLPATPPAIICMYFGIDSFLILTLGSLSLYDNFVNMEHICSYDNIYTPILGTSLFTKVRYFVSKYVHSYFTCNYLNLIIIIVPPRYSDRIPLVLYSSVNNFIGPMNFDG